MEGVVARLELGSGRRRTLLAAIKHEDWLGCDITVGPRAPGDDASFSHATSVCAR
jgi:hypothetical protein